MQTGVNYKPWYSIGNLITSLPSVGTCLENDSENKYVMSVAWMRVLSAVTLPVIAALERQVIKARKITVIRFKFETILN